MSAAEYRYRGLIVEAWDLLRGDTSGWSSRPYFLDVIRASGEPALDVACGTGRILLDYLEEGVDIDGVDVSPEMIAVCREKAARAGLDPGLYVQPMEALSLPRRYQTIIVPSSSFLHLTERDRARQALGRFYDHLLPGGVLCMSMRVFEPDAEEEEFELIAEAERPEDGAAVKQYFRCWYEPEKRLQHTEYRYDVEVDGRVVASETHTNSPDLTWYLVSEAVALLEGAGFVEVEAQSDFTTEPATDADTSYTVLGVRPPGST